MLHVRWSVTAFDMLESPPSKTAFEIVDITDKLAAFPELGVSLGHRYSRFGNCRQFVFKQRYRLVYVYEPDEREIRILLVQHCRQRIPTTAHLRRALKEITSENDPDTE